jgi:uncharacterized protein (TIGR03083 family)
LAADERADLADFLATLSPEEWQAPTLCDQWRVREVVAHLISYDDLDARGVLRRMGRARLNLNRANTIGVGEYDVLGPEGLLAHLRDHPLPRGLTAGLGGRIALLDGLIHNWLFDPSHNLRRAGAQAVDVHLAGLRQR